MPLDSYQQLRTVGALFTEERQYVPIFTTMRLSSHMGRRRLRTSDTVMILLPCASFF